jgi:hypothetical protein
MRSNMRRVSRPVVLSGSLLILFILAYPHFDHTVDDAFISFRYAQNWLEGHGLVFNPGERVEGYTNFLWIVLLTPFMALDVDPQLAARILGLAASAGLLAAVVRFAPAPEAAPEVVAYAPLLCCTSPVLTFWATGGLEGPLFAAFAIASTGLMAEGLARGTLSPAAALLAALAALTRPEGVAFAAALFLAALLGSSRPSYREIARWAAVFLVLYLPYFVWRYAYYGDLLPNTFHAKIGFGTPQVVRGLRYVGAFLEESSPLLLLPLAGLWWQRRNSTVLLLGLLLLCSVGYVVLIGGDSLPMFRFLLPALPLAFLLLAWGVAGALQRAAWRPTARLVAALAMLALSFLAALPGFRGTAVGFVQSDRREVGAWKEIGRYFAEHAPRDASIAVITAGAIPFFSKLRTIDMLGLSDRTIAHRDAGALGTGYAGHEKYDVDYVLDRAPTIVVIGTYGIAPDARPAEEILRPFYPAEEQMLRSPRFLRDYVLVRARSASGYFAYFVRRDRLPVAPPSS